MPRTSSQFARWIGGAAVVVGLAAPTVLHAQVPTPGTLVQVPPSAVPKFPTLPTPQTAPAPAAAPAQPAKPEPAKAEPRAEGRDPFDPLVTKAPEGESRPSLSGVRLVGVIWDPVRRDQIRALLETPDGLGYYVRLNEEKFGGKVVAIERDRVRFSVREQDPGGQARVRTVELKLSQ